MKNSYTNEKVVLSKYPSGIAKKENFSIIKENINTISENDPQNYYFIFNRDKNTSLPNDNSISSQKTVKIYGDLDVTGTVHCDKVILSSGIEITQSNSGTQISTTTNTNPEIIQSQNDIELSGKQLSWLYSDKTVIGLYDTNIINFLKLFYWDCVRKFIS